MSRFFSRHCENFAKVSSQLYSPPPGVTSPRPGDHGHPVVEPEVGLAAAAAAPLLACTLRPGSPHHNQPASRYHRWVASSVINNHFYGF